MECTAQFRPREFRQKVEEQIVECARDGVDGELRKLSVMYTILVAAVTYG
jgi:hypothetical protein